MVQEQRNIGHFDNSTLWVLEGHYGNDGYAFLFKMLGSLALAEGHYLDLSDEAEATWVAFQAKTLISRESCIGLFNLLVQLGVIDKELWEVRRIVWCQNYIDDLSKSFDYIGREVPKKPQV